MLLLKVLSLQYLSIEPVKPKKQICMRCYVFLSDESLLTLRHYNNIRFNLQQSAWFLDGRTSTCLWGAHTIANT